MCLIYLIIRKDFSPKCRTVFSDSTSSLIACGVLFSAETVYTKSLDLRGGVNKEPAYPIFDGPRQSGFSRLVSIHVYMRVQNCTLIESLFNKILNVKHG